MWRALKFARACAPTRSRVLKSHAHRAFKFTNAPEFLEACALRVPRAFNEWICIIYIQDKYDSKFISKIT